MIAEKQAGVRQRIVRDVNKLREWVKSQILVKQKPELDEKVKSVDVKKIVRKKILVSLKKGVGASFGKKIGALGRRLGRSLTRFFGF